jgi:hypothetical protein
MSHTKLWRSCGCLSFIALLAGCSNDPVDLGGGREPREVQPGERCSNGASIVHGPVTVHDQNELEQLAGCEQIDGDLHIEVFSGADLRPLSALSIVDGLLEIGAYPESALDLNTTEELMALAADVDQISADGYLSSLAGLEGLRRAGSLQLSYIAAEDLEPLLGLRQLSGRGAALLGSPPGSSSINYAANLRDLHGLSNVESVQSLSLAETPALTSLGGIQFASTDTAVSLTDSPLLSSLAELEPLDSLASLGLSNVGITDLDSLANLIYVAGEIYLRGNPNLRNIDGLFASLNEIGIGSGWLSVTGNAVLQSIPSLHGVSGLDMVTVSGNPELRSLHLDLPTEAPAWNSLHGAPLKNPIELIDIGQNDSLTELSLSAALENGRVIAVYENAALVHVSMGALQHLEELDITGNANLEQIDVGALQTVDQLSVINNPKLDVAQLAAVRRFNAIVGRNAASP